MRRPAGLRSSVPPRAFVALACSIAAACGPAGASDTSGRAETSAGECEPGTVRGPAPRTAAPLVRHATGFTLSRSGDHTVLEVHPPADRGGGRDVMVLIRCDRAAPALEGSLEAAHVVRVPVRTAAANEDLSLTRLRVLGRTESITAMGSGGVYDPALRALWESGAAVEIGASFHGPPRFEALLAVQPGITFLSSASLGEAASLRRARELGLRAAPSLSWVESSLLGQAEWLIYVAAFLGEEERAREHLDRVEARYRGLSETARAEGARPLVLWIEPSGAGDRWVVPANSWKAGAIADAGGRLAFARPDGPVTIEVDSERILELADSIDFVVTESIALSEPASAGALETLPALREGRVYSVHRRARPEHNAYDWYESAVVEVDLVLADFVALLHPTVLPGHRYHHLVPARTPPGPHAEGVH